MERKFYFNGRKHVKEGSRGKEQKFINVAVTFMNTTPVKDKSPKDIKDMIEIGEYLFTNLEGSVLKRNKLKLNNITPRRDQTFLYPSLQIQMDLPRIPYLNRVRN